MEKSSHDASRIQRKTAKFSKGPSTETNGMTLTPFTFYVPLNYDESDSEKNSVHIPIFLREVVATGKETHDLPFLLYLEGGPGLSAPRPVAKFGWLQRALEEFRVLLLDQRGTGNSFCITTETIRQLYDIAKQRANAKAGTKTSVPINNPATFVADFLACFRADSIVRDCEIIRETIKDASATEIRWTLLGQSYGGFVTCSYLTMAPQHLKAALVAGGLPPVNKSVNDIYDAILKRMADRNRRFYRRYPEDIEIVRDIVTTLQTREVYLPSGSRLTARRFLQLGINLGMAEGMENLHYILEYAFFERKTCLVDIENSLKHEDVLEKDFSGTKVRPSPQTLGLSQYFLHLVESLQTFEYHPLYFLLHESIYLNGPGNASNWSCKQRLEQLSEFNWEKNILEKGKPIFFTGEMVFPWMCTDYKKFCAPFNDIAEALAQREAWSSLYCEKQLSRNEVPVAAVIFEDDMYVDSKHSEDTANLIKNSRIWFTKDHQHSGLRDDGYNILTRLLRMLH